MNVEKKMFYKEWENLETVFEELEKCDICYVVLRNYEQLPELATIEGHGDIDILTSDKDDIIKALGAKKVHDKKYRVQYQIAVGNILVYMDIRYVGDNYYDREWELQILNNRVKNLKGIYIPNDTDYAYSLLYHSLIHKPYISDDYRTKMKVHFGENNLLKKLNEFMSEKQYKFVEPIDLSVYYNYNIIAKKTTIKRRIYLLKCEIDYMCDRIKKIFYKGR
ncbi:MAG: hypothetical protein E7299_00160 [Lachnospiraceae bacterium]|nr:hypothetical protein [Lachnospiraceae bacterium]